jgi:heparan-alpha-glucosaminide N-acetyltransferase
VSAVPRPPRLLSVDLIRGLDVFLMLFVNEMSGVTGTPAFLRHVGPQVDGMTLTDVVFPAFLFITGMSIPLALGARLRAGESCGRVVRHILLRSVSLIVIGVLMVNAEDRNIR